MVPGVPLKFGSLFSQVEARFGKSRREPAGDPESLRGRKHRTIDASHYRHGDPRERSEPVAGSIALP